MFIFTGREAVGSADIHFAKGIFCVDCFYPLSECLFSLGAGRECEGKNHREREVLAALGSPLSLRFSPSRSLFPYPLLSEGVSLLFDLCRLLWYELLAYMNRLLDMSRCLIAK